MRGEFLSAAREFTKKTRAFFVVRLSSGLIVLFACTYS